LNSREEILAAVKQNQPEELPLPDLSSFLDIQDADATATFTRVVEGIGARVIRVKSDAEIIERLRAEFDVSSSRVVSPLEAFSEIAEMVSAEDNHQLSDVELMILPVQFAVAENGACWVDDESFDERVLPFISQHLAFVLDLNKIVPTMHHAYKVIGNKKYGFGTFIAGPSKTADIEQSLVLGAHGPRSLWCFLIG
jgi:L-lactate dehydrogenase complex protein LldG